MLKNDKSEHLILCLCFNVKVSLKICSNITGIIVHGKVPIRLELYIWLMYDMQGYMGFTILHIEAQISTVQCVGDFVL